jgi:hypothetical protein
MNLQPSSCDVLNAIILLENTRKTCFLSFVENPVFNAVGFGLALNLIKRQIILQFLLQLLRRQRGLPLSLRALQAWYWQRVLLNLEF